MIRCNPENVLAMSGIRKTRQRVDLLGLMIEAVSFSASQLQKDLPDVDLATVYRFIHLLKNHGIVREIAYLDGQQFFEYVCEHHPPHGHFYCENCARLFCLPPLDFNQSNVLIRNAGNHRVEQVSLIMKGVCKACRES